MNAILFLTLIGEGFWVFTFHHQTNSTLLLHAAIIGDLICMSRVVWKIARTPTHTYTFVFISHLFCDTDTHTH